MNSVTLYSNGTAVISREHNFKDTDPVHITIPVKKADLDDVISSLCVFGDVTIISPPSYAPVNSQYRTLTLNPDNVLREMATKLAGSAVVVEAGTQYSGKLLGLHQQRRESGGTVFKQYRLVVLTEKGVQQIEENAVTAIRFTDAVIQSEIDKALQAHFNGIKPDRSLVELTIQPASQNSIAQIQYAIPAAAWKCRYQVRMSSTKAELEGQAIVDNDTDDDWTDSMVTVVTGEPITFSTDLAETHRPARRHVKLVPGEATGAVTAEAEICLDLADDEEEMACLSAAPSAGHAVMAAVPRFDRITQADQAQSEVRESGDFSIFHSPHPVTIAAKKSAIVPLFRASTDDAKVVLFYREEADASRPFRAIRFQNQTTHSLGRGVCEVFIDTHFQGKCILEPTKPGEELLLIHAKETGVRVFKDTSRPESRRMAIKISDGLIYCEVLHRQKVAYRVQNSHSSAFTLDIEHPRTWNDSKLTVTVSAAEPEVVDIPSGQRIRTTLEENGGLSVEVIEEHLERQAYSLDMNWIRNSLVEIDAPASRNKGIQKCVKLQEQIDLLQAQIKEHEEAAQAWEQEQKRLLKLIPAAHAEQANEWRTDLATAEKELREIRRTSVPTLKGQIQEARTSLQKALSSLAFSWKSEEALH
jgi:hypothetical protein